MNDSNVQALIEALRKRTNELREIHPGESTFCWGRRPNDVGADELAPDALVHAVEDLVYEQDFESVDAAVGVVASDHCTYHVSPEQASGLVYILAHPEDVRNIRENKLPVTITSRGLVWISVDGVCITMEAGRWVASVSRESRHLATLVPVAKKLGAFLHELRDYKEFAKVKLGVSESYAHRLPMFAAQWLPIASDPVQPDSLDSLRPLKRIANPEQKLEAWKQAVAAAGNKAPDAAHVAAAVREILREEDEAPKLSKAQLLAQEVLALLKQQQVEAAQMRLEREIGVVGMQPAVAAAAERSSTPSAEKSSGAKESANEILVADSDCTVERNGRVFIVRADPAFGQGMTELGLKSGDVAGVWMMLDTAKKPVDAERLIAQVRAVLKQSQIQLG